MVHKGLGGVGCLGSSSLASYTGLHHPDGVGLLPQSSSSSRGALGCFVGSSRVKGGQSQSGSSGRWIHSSVISLVGVAGEYGGAEGLASWE